MLILLNPYSGGRTAMKKWKIAAPRVRSVDDAARVVSMGTTTNVDAEIVGALEEGERRFVAAGGDGTLNMLLNSIIRNATSEQLADIRLGAIGLGSSNDFHKPFRKDHVVDGISCKIDFDTARPRDVGCLRAFAGGRWSSNYFLVNASIGTTAEANRFFNHPDTLLRLLKRAHTQTAILYAALRTISRHKNIPASCNGSHCGWFSASVSTVGVFKNPHFSGNLSYGGSARYDDGVFEIRLYKELHRLGMIRLLTALLRGSDHTTDNCLSWTSAAFSLSSEAPFSVEFDGEVLFTQRVEFSVLPRYLKVCP